MFQKFFLSGVFILITTVSFAQSSAVGVWQSVDGKTGQANSHIEIYESNGKYYGKIIKILDNHYGENAVCVNCSGTKKNKPILGLVIIEHASLSNGVYSNATVISPNSGSEYSLKFWVDKSNPNKLMLRGYKGISVFGQSPVWTRVN